jgi:hypothetical protein
MTKALTSTEVVYELVRAKAVGKLSVSGADPVIVTGPLQDREHARAVLKAAGLTLTSSVDQDEYSRDVLRSTAS